MSGLDSYVRYRILYEPWQTYKLCAEDINASRTAAVYLKDLGTDCEDEWQVVNASTGNFALRSLRYEGEHSLLSVFVDHNEVIAIRIIFADDEHTFPIESQWTLDQSAEGVFTIQNRANGTDWYFSTSDEPTYTTEGVWMRDFGTNLTFAGDWTFVSQGVIAAPGPSNTSTSSPTPSPSASSSSSESGPLARAGAKAGVAVGVIVFVMIAALAAFLLFKRNRRRRTGAAGPGITHGPLPQTIEKGPAELAQLGTSEGIYGSKNPTTPSELMGSYSSREYQIVPQELEGQTEYTHAKSR